MESIIIHGGSQTFGDGLNKDCLAQDHNLEFRKDHILEEESRQDHILKFRKDHILEEEESLEFRKAHILEKEEEEEEEEESEPRQDDILETRQDHMLEEEEESSTENSISVTNNQNEDTVSDNESIFSCVSVSNSVKVELFGSGFVRLDRNHELYGDIENRFLLDLAKGGVNTQVVAIHKNACSSFNGQTKLRSFEIFLKAHEQTGRGNANLKQAWFTASKAQITTILSRGFFESTDNGIYGRGIYLSPLDFTLDCLQSSVADEDGMRHLVLCRVIMGRMELVAPGSGQSCPSSEDYDSGVDDLLRPKKYIIWGCHMNTHILPVVVISFKAPPNLTRAGGLKVSAPWKQPRSPWIPLPTLIAALSKFLPKDGIKLLQKHQDSLKEKKITREEVVKKFRDIAGDRLLVAVIKSYRNKMYGSKDCPPKGNCNKYTEQRRGDCSSSSNQIIDNRFVTLNGNQRSE